MNLISFFKPKEFWWFLFDFKNNLSGGIHKVKQNCHWFSPKP